MRFAKHLKHVAVVVLQLVAERRLGLDATVETYLPGLVRGEGIDGRHITVRQLLQHTHSIRGVRLALKAALEQLGAHGKTWL